VSLDVECYITFFPFRITYSFSVRQAARMEASDCKPIFEVRA